MVVTGTYNLAPLTETISNYTYDPSGALATTDTAITISVTGVDSVTQTITVAPVTNEEPEEDEE